MCGHTPRNERSSAFEPPAHRRRCAQHPSSRIQCGGSEHLSLGVCNVGKRHRRRRQLHVARLLVVPAASAAAALPWHLVWRSRACGFYWRVASRVPRKARRRHEDLGAVRASEPLSRLHHGPASRLQRGHHDLAHALVLFSAALVGLHGAPAVRGRPRKRVVQLRHSRECVANGRRCDGSASDQHAGR
jgi:hypothetical protein